MTRPTLVWFRHDPRLAGNPAPMAARALDRQAIGLFPNPDGDGASSPMAQATS